MRGNGGPPDLSHLAEEDRALVRRLYGLGEQALATQAPVYTDFLDPRQRAVAGRELAVLPGLRLICRGGYRRAERQRLVLVPDFLLVEAIAPGLAYLEVRPAAAAGLGREDYMAALLELGVERGKIGDLIVDGDGCQIVAAAEAAPYLQANPARVGGAGVPVVPIEPEQLRVPAERIEEVRTTVASPRLDAVAAHGFGVSRARMAHEIGTGRVRVNWQPALKPDKLLRAGDIVSSRGRGRVVVVEVARETRKGRLGLVLRVER